MKYLLGILIGAALLGGGWYIVHEQSHDEDHHHDEDHAHEHELTAREPVRADGSFAISTSFYPLQFALERIAGEQADIINIGAGRDPHDFRPSTQAIRTLQDSDLVVLQGAGFEPWGADIEAQLKERDIPFLLATTELALYDTEDDHHDDHEASAERHNEDEHDEHLDEQATHEEDDHDNHEHGQFDPHTWLDPVLFSETVEHLAEALATLDPEFADVYMQNAAALQAELATLDNEYQTRLAECRYEKAIISHDAFGYLAERYELTLHPIAGLSTQDTPSATILAELKAEAEEGVGAILLEESSVTAYGDTLARETGLTTLAINPIAFTIPDDATYLTLMEANLDTLVTAFACNETD